jgi:uncharacterized protein HemX
MRILWVVGILLVLLIGLVVYFFIGQRKYLHKKTSETMSKDLWQDIQQEREENLQRKKSFQEKLEKAKKDVERK